MSPISLSETLKVRGSLLICLGVGAVASWILGLHPVSSHIRFPRFLFPSPAHLPVAHPSGFGLNVFSQIPQGWTGHHLGDA